jgi:hypothetical protein
LTRPPGWQAVLIGGAEYSRVGIVKTLKYREYFGSFCQNELLTGLDQVQIDLAGPPDFKHVARVFAKM